MFYPWDRLPACPFLVVISSGCFAVLSKVDRLEAYAVFPTGWKPIPRVSLDEDPAVEYHPFEHQKADR
jgi:hypothetical protein